MGPVGLSLAGPARPGPAGARGRGVGADPALLRGANGERVKAAGTGRVHKGVLTQLTNISGHYLPFGRHAKQSAENAFNGAGFNANGIYYEHKFPK
jgi:hypothetical protein